MFSAAGLAGSLVCGASAPKKSKAPEPVARIKLSDFGAPAVGGRLLDVGASMFTVDFVDSEHLLVTYSSRTLVKRSDLQERDSDARNVTAAILTLPSGSVVATTEWLLHDHARYLWALGDGRFVVRMGKLFSIMDVRAQMGGKDPFLRKAFEHWPGEPISIIPSPDSQIFAAIRQLPPKEQHGPVVKLGETSDNQPKAEYLMSYFRVREDGETHPAGAVKAAIPIALPMNADGYLWTEEKNRNVWAFSFNPFGGAKPVAMGEMPSACPPRARLLSHSQFAVISCQGISQDPRVQVLGFDGHEVWEEDFPAFPETPSFITAPAAGRFAMSFRRAAVGSPAPGTMQPDPSARPAFDQEVRVYQSESGDLLLKLALSPVMETAENFDLTADGRELVVLEGDELQLYDLPAPSKKDLAELAEVNKFAPPTVGDAKVSLSRLAEAPPEVAASLQTPIASSTEAGQGAVAAASGAEPGTLGDATGPRKRPTLLNPGEKAEYQDKLPPRN
ncbi:hypothetical protein ACFQBQ_17695 [Granulicella cerasi]|uniref:Uncharacterized protein n=1 Tax=Granulicella cerasi TaxID=741063 RepID=A0ABW1ZD04_9BACT|nr:hypothetical protein [Granulicella cerasi]